MSNELQLEVKDTCWCETTAHRLSTYMKALKVKGMQHDASFPGRRQRGKISEPVNWTRTASVDLQTGVQKQETYRFEGRRRSGLCNPVECAVFNRCRLSPPIPRSMQWLVDVESKD
nr:hypothetical protein CFP56_63097 [Quercus suber]